MEQKAHADMVKRSTEATKWSPRPRAQGAQLCHARAALHMLAMLRRGRARTGVNAHVLKRELEIGHVGLHTPLQDLHPPAGTHGVCHPDCHPGCLLPKPDHIFCTSEAERLACTLRGLLEACSHMQRTQQTQLGTTCTTRRTEDGEQNAVAALDQDQADVQQQLLQHRQP